MDCGSCFPQPLAVGEERPVPPPTVDERAEVIGGADKGGILVREGQALSSKVGQLLGVDSFAFLYFYLDRHTFYYMTYKIL